MDYIIKNERLTNYISTYDTTTANIQSKTTTPTVSHKANLSVTTLDSKWRAPRVLWRKGKSKLQREFCKYFLFLLTW